MAGIYLQNTKATRVREEDTFRKVACKCGSKRIEAEIVGTAKETDEIDEDKKQEGAGDWLLLRCAGCGAVLYYNGA